MYCFKELDCTDKSKATYIQFTETTTAVQGGVSEADKLNGIEWKGKVALYPTGSMRTTTKCGSVQWSEWKTAGTVAAFLHGITVDLKKKKDGSWIKTLEEGHYQTRVTCDEIPK